jgi:hypothetical protein
MKRKAQARVVAVVSEPAANKSMAVTHSCSSEKLDQGILKGEVSLYC